MPVMKPITSRSAKRIILQKATPARIASVALTQSPGKIIAENIFADSDQPSAAKSAVDGIAISFNAWKKGRLQFLIKGMQKAGIAAKVLLKPQHCFEIMTGAVIPKHCDCVIPVENVKIVKATATLKPDLKIFKGQFIRKQASEYKKNERLIAFGTKINSTHIAVCASTGKRQLNVFSPKIALIGTGDELIAIDKKPQSYQSRRSNTYALETLLCSQGFSDVKKFHFNDNFSVIKKNLSRVLLDFDVVILSGGVSMGKFDFVPGVLNELQVKTLFHKVSQKPGKPLLFAKTHDGKAVFGLPGNPVSTLVCAVYYVLPFLYKKCGVRIKDRAVRLAKSIRQNSNLTLFVPVTFNATASALPVKLSSSGNFRALTASEGFIEVPPGTGSLEKGKEAKFFSW